MEGDREFLLEAFEQAQRALADGTYPIGAVVVDDEGRIMGRGRNRVCSTGDTTAHAEVDALRNARPIRIDTAGRRFLTPRHTLYTTTEPCLLCAGAIVMSNIHRVVWAADDPANGAVRLLQSLPVLPAWDHLGQKIRRLVVGDESFPDLAALQIDLMRRWNAARGLPGVVWSICGGEQG